MEKKKKDMDSEARLPVTYRCDSTCALPVREG